MKYAMILAAVVWAGTVCGQTAYKSDTPATKPATQPTTPYAVEGERQRQKEIASYQRQLDAESGKVQMMKEGKADVTRSRDGRQQHGFTFSKKTGKYWFPSESAKQEQIEKTTNKIAEYQTKIDGLKNQKGHYVPWIYLPEVGAAGRLKFPTKVEQVIDGKQMLVLYLAGEKEFTIWLDGVSTMRLVDGQDHQILAPISITGTKQYRTAIGGTRTVFYAVPADPSPN